MEKVIGKAIRGVLENLNIPESGFVVERPADESHGDYSSNVAMAMFAALSTKMPDIKSPRVLAEQIVDELKKNTELMDVVEGITVAGPGFVNFRLKTGWLVEQVCGVDERYGSSDSGKGKKILVEYSSPNIAKDFSVGHLRSTIIGQAIRNLYDFSGWETIGDNHLGDWGTQFGMIIAAVEESNKDISTMSVSEMESLYVEYNQRIKDDVKLRDVAKKAFVRLENGDESARQIWEKATAASLNEFARIYEMLGVEIENAYGESSYEELMKEVISDAKKAGLARESEGATIIEFDDMAPGILLKSDGGTTYFTRDLATIKFRNKQFGADRYVYEVGAEQGLHFKQVFAGAEKLGYGKQGEWVHVGHGLILGEDGKKMSTRKGTGVKMETWLELAKEKAKSINPDSAKEVGIGAVKFFDLKHSPATSYKFVWEAALSLEGDSGPYVQYSVVRGQSVLAKAGSVALDSSPVKDDKMEVSEEELVVMRWITRFPEVVEMAAKNYAPNLVAEYVLELSKRFNGFYNKHKIIGGENEAFGLRLTKAVVQVLSAGLGILGIEVPERM